MILPQWYPPILAYHRVHPTLGSDTPTLAPEIFERQMEILSRKWNPVPLSVLVSWLDGAAPLPHRAVVVTLDDGTDDTFSYAFPILKRYRIPAMIFMIAHHLDKNGSLRREQVLEMSQAGIDFGSHTLSHAYLPSLSSVEVSRQLVESKKILESLGCPIRHFSYPAGGFTLSIIDAVQKAGYQSACTTNRGFRRFPIDRWALRRTTMHQKASSDFGIWLRCCGYDGLNRRLRSPA